MKLIYLILLITITSCTLTKRMHQPGYHIEWNKKHMASSSKQDLEKFIPNSETNKMNRMVDETTVNSVYDTTELNESSIPDTRIDQKTKITTLVMIKKLTKEPSNKINNTPFIKNVKATIKNRNTGYDDEEEKTSRKHRIKGIVFLILSVLIGVLLITNLIIGFVYYLYLLVNFILVVLLLIFFVKMIINFRKADNKEKYKEIIKEKYKDETPKENRNRIKKAFSISLLFFGVLMALLIVFALTVGFYGITFLTGFLTFIALLFVLVNGLRLLNLWEVKKTAVQ